MCAFQSLIIYRELAATRRRIKAISAQSNAEDPDKACLTISWTGTHRMARSVFVCLIMEGNLPSHQTPSHACCFMFCIVFTLCNRMSLADIFVTEFLTEVAGRLRGHVKLVPSDFQVIEVDEEGCPADFTDTSCGKADDGDEELLPSSGPFMTALDSIRVNTASEQSDPAYASQSLLVHAEASTQGTANATEADLLSKDQLQALTELQGRLVERVKASDFDLPEKAVAGSSWCVKIPQPANRQLRTRLHQAVKIQFPFLVTRSTPSDSGNGTEASISCVPDLGIAQVLSLHLDFEQLSTLQAYISRGADHPEASVGIRLGPENDKAKRKALHQAVAEACRFLETTTVTDEADTFVKVAWRPRKKNKRKRADGGTQSSKRSFVRFVLKKENVEHHEALRRLGEVLNIGASCLTYGGIKDKRAVTQQFITVKGIDMAALQAANDRLNGTGLSIGSCMYVERPLQPGQTQGNKFRIVVRDVEVVEAPDDGQALPTASVIRTILAEHIASLSSKGMINYLGAQRVGTPGPSFHTSQCFIGRALLRGDYEDAIRIIMTPRHDDSSRVREAKCRFLAGEPVEQVLKSLPHCTSRERTMLQALHRHGRQATLKALRSLPFAWTNMCMNAYQGYLWNRMASERIRKLGRKPVAGDLVIDDDPPVDESSVTGEALVNQHVNRCQKHGRPVPRVLTADDMGASMDLEGLMHRVVLPVAGHEVSYPQNELGEVYRQVLAEDGVVGLQIKGRCDFEAKGAYRHLLIRPREVQWRVCERYAEIGHKGDTRVVHDLEVEFGLGPGSFATVLLREALKDDQLGLETEASNSEQLASGGRTETEG